MKEHLMSINNTQTPKVLDGSMAEKMCIMRLILMEPGLYETHPKMGVGLVSKYRFKNTAEIEATLPDAIKVQMSTYMPQIVDPEVEVTFKEDTAGNNTIVIGITSNDFKAIITVDEETRNLVSLL